MKNISLPTDIKQYVKKNVISQIIKFAVFEIVILLFIIFLGERAFGMLGNIWQAVIYIVMLVIPCIVTKMPFKLIDKTWSGEIINIELKSRISMDKSDLYGWAHHGENVIWLTVKRNDGKIVKTEGAIYNFRAAKDDHDTKEIKPEHFLTKEKYKIGDTIVHFYGLKHLAVISDTQKSTVSCVVCGNQNSAQKVECWSCGHTLVKIGTGAEGER